MENHNITPVETLYDSRSNFTIIGLTGKTGCGCSYLAELMSSTQFLKDIRKPEDIIVPQPPFLQNEDAYYNDKQGVQNQAIRLLVEKKKYQICYKYDQVYYKPYRVIKYTHVIWLYVGLSYSSQYSKECQSLKEFVRVILIDKFTPSVGKRDDDYKKRIGYSDEKRQREIDDILDGFTRWEELAGKFSKVTLTLGKSHVSDGEAKELVGVFTCSVFKYFISYLLEKLVHTDVYSLCFLHHRLATQIRKAGNPYDHYSVWYQKEDTEYENLYQLVKLVNFIIKGFRKDDESKGNDRNGTRVVIDSIRNSIEAAYLKERYSAFYLLAVSNDTDRELQLSKSIQEKSEIKDEGLLHIIQEKIDFLSSEELKNDDFEKGMFSSPNVSQVIADAEIHLSNNLSHENKFPFSSLAEQWLKYSSLIMHPGLITPSSEERCMVVAYTAKFNSSCISRQVGAVITNKYHSIRTIGWNEVPYGQMPCGLRDVRELLNDKCECHKCQYSEFERDNNTANIYKDYSKFVDKVTSDDNVNKDSDAQLKGLPYPYCFKTLHNRYEKEKNQVYTRSLHAEENAILQMAKYGGEPLMDGIIYVTASPCELCSKKLYQIGVRKIVYIDPYPGIAKEQIINAGFKRPNLKLFQGAYGASYFKLYQPFMSYKDELSIRLPSKKHTSEKSKDELLEAILSIKSIDSKDKYSQEEFEKIVHSFRNNTTVLSD